MNEALSRQIAWPAAKLLPGLLLMLLACSSAWSATVWKWVGSDGVVHYSDQPVPGAVQVDLNVQTYNASEAAIPTTQRSRSTPAKAAAPSYQSIEITNPANEETIVNTGGQVSVSVTVEPGVSPGDSILLEMDGQTVSQPHSTATQFALTDVPRGAHSLVASVVSSSGQRLIQSKNVTFFVQQHSILHPK